MEQAEKPDESVPEKEDEKPATVDDAVDRAFQELSTPDDAPEKEVEPAAEAPDPSVEAPAEEISEPTGPEAPEWWGDDTGTWEALNVEARERLIARDRERTEAIERDRMAPEVVAAVRQIEDHAKMYGLSADQALGRLHQSQRLLETNTRYALAQLAQQYGVDPSDIAALSDGTGETQPAVDPSVMIQQIVQRELGQYQAQQAEQQTQNALDELTEWSKEKGEDGKPLRPHFEELQHLVKPEMDRLLAENPRRDRWKALDTAYTNVAKLKEAPVDVESLAEARARKLFEEKQAEARKSQAASISPPSSVSGTAPDYQERPKTVDDAVDRAYQELSKDAAARI